jgi:TolA-binding protein
VWPLLAAAATLILAIGAWPLLRGAPAPPPAATAGAPSSTPAPAPAPAQTTAALGPAIEKAPVVLAASRVLVFRNKASADPFVEAFAVAIEPYRKDDYPEAITRLDALARKYPDADEAPFYLGVSLLIASRPADAVAPLRRAANGRDAAIAAQARRYLALATTR